MGKSWKSRNELSHFQSIDFPQGWQDNGMGEWAIFSANGTRTAGYPHQRMKFVAVLQLLSCVRLLATPWTAAHQAILFIISQSLLKLMSIESMMPPNHLILYCPLSSCPQSFPASGSFPMSWLFASGSQSIGASASVLSMNIQGWFPLGLTGLILLFKGLLCVYSTSQMLKG